MNIEITHNETETVVSLVGRLDTVTSPELGNALEPYVNGAKTVVLECGSMEYISSSGLRVILSAHKSIKSSGGTLVVRNLNREVRSVFELTGLTRVFCLE